MTRAAKGFTLIELLIVAGIISILAAIAVPNLLEAQTRSKVSAAQANLKTLTTALEAYAVDYNRYPATQPIFPEDPFGLLATYQLRKLTTPVAYCTSGSFRDPFGMVQAQTLPLHQVRINHQTSGNDFPTLTPPNPEKAFMYYHYESMSARANEPLLAIRGAGVVSIGPDSQDTLGAYRPLPPEFFTTYFAFTDVRHPLDTVYDPTNGTVSAGDISDFAGQARQFSDP